jgi:hypothetical protein
MTIKTTIRTQKTVRTIVRGTGRPGINGSNGAPGADGPNIITPNTDVSFPGSGLLGHAGGKSVSVDPGQFAQWTPTLIANETFTVPENRQVLFALPITIEEDGILEVNGELIEV